MDLLKIIEEQIQDIKLDGSSDFLDLIYNHLSRAELYYLNGKEDDQFYNDVIYRTNQAFEGALKEAYKVLGSKSDEEVSRKTPNEIERYLKDNVIFKDRVLKLFENYRQEWRNKSTHDYKLVLDENEAFLAFVNVSSFVHLLLKQIKHKASYNSEMTREVSETAQIKTSEVVNSDKSLVDKVLDLLAVFIKELERKYELKEVEIAARLRAFFDKYHSNLIVYHEPNFKIGQINIRLDFVIEDENEKVVIEIKSNLNKKSWSSGMQQLSSYLTLTGIRNGILFSGNSHMEGGTVTVNRHEIIVNEIVYNIYVIF